MSIVELPKETNPYDEARKLLAFAEKSSLPFVLICPKEFLDGAEDQVVVSILSPAPSPSVILEQLEEATMMMRASIS